MTSRKFDVIFSSSEWSELDQRKTGTKRQKLPAHLDAILSEKLQKIEINCRLKCRLISIFFNGIAKSQRKMISFLNKMRFNNKLFANSLPKK
jgi:hypothetical protein